jgi:hypothetical protein
MALTRRELKREIPPAPDPRQLSLFGLNPDQSRPKVGRRQRGTGCSLFCTCDTCLNGRS